MFLSACVIKISFHFLCKYLSFLYRDKGRTTRVPDKQYVPNRVTRRAMYERESRSTDLMKSGPILLESHLRDVSFYVLFDRSINV